MRCRSCPRASVAELGSEEAQGGVLSSGPGGPPSAEAAGLGEEGREAMAVEEMGGGDEFRVTTRSPAVGETVAAEVPEAAAAV